MRYKLIITAMVVILLATWWLHKHAPLNITDLPMAKGVSSMPTQYLAFQIFTSTDNVNERANFPPMREHIDGTVDDIIRKLGSVGSKNRKLGFVIGPLSFNNSDDEIRKLIRESFAVALRRNIAVGFHLDDSMFWTRLSHLNRIDNIEWLDWNKTPNTGRRLDWSSTPTKIMPQLCFNSPVVKLEVKKRAAVIGEEVKRGLASLKTAAKEHLFLGVINGWETQIGRDFDTGKSLGYNALTNKGYSAAKPPADIDEARADIVAEFVDMWASALADSGVPDGKIYSHIAFMPLVAYDPSGNGGQPDQPVRSYLETINFTPTRIAFGPHRIAGFSTYPMPGHLEQIKDELKKHSGAQWASCEGTAMDPGAADKGGGGMSMEAYLGNLYNHGAVLVNVFGWAVGDASNPFRRTAENPKAIKAYQKFLRGEKLTEDPTLGGMPTIGFIAKIRRVQKEMPIYVQKNGPKDIQPLAQNLEKYMKLGQYADAEKAVDEILKLIGK